MKVDAAISPSLYVQQRPEGLPPGKGEGEVPEPLTPDPETSVSSLDSIGPAENDDENGETTKGVLSLLQRGHFTGVADVRLRINFFDELAAIEQNQMNTIISKGIDGILESVTSTLKSGEPAETPVDAVIEPFEQAIKESKEAFLAAEVRSTDTLLRDLESVVEKLVLSLTQNLASTTTAENLMDEDAPPDIETDENNRLSDYITAVRAAFSTAMDELTKALSGPAIVPEVSAPKGNGVAYDKFLTIYNEMQTARAPIDNTIDIEHLDTSA